jgi:short-subunit dehydrogenase
MAAVAHLALAVLSDMQRRGAGHIINISSIAGSLPEQGIAIYGATRSFVDSFTTSLHREVRDSPVEVSLMRLGPVRTEFYDQAASRASGRPVPGERFAIPPERVAQQVLSLLKRPRRVVHVPGWGSLTPWVEPTFGWLIDLLGPALLRRPAARD